MPEMTTIHEEDNLALLQSGKYSDFVLACNGVEWNLHKAVVCAHSPVIAAAFDGEFMEAKLGRYSDKEHDVATMARLIQYVYVKDYSSNPLLAGTWPSMEILQDEERQSKLEDTSQPSPRCLKAEISLNIAADFYQIPALSAMTRSRIERIINHRWDAATFPALLERAEGNLADTRLWKILIDAAATHTDSLAKSKEFHEVDWQTDTYKQIICAQARMSEEEEAKKKKKASQSSYDSRRYGFLC